MKIGLCVPTFNAAKMLPEFLKGLNGCTFDEKIAIDSSSTDRTVQILETCGFSVYRIPKSEFDHGGTRQLGVKLLHNCDIIVFLTQDAVVTSPQSIAELIKAFDSPQVAIAYGRQLPRIASKPIEAHARIFSYPPSSLVKTKALIPTLGLRAAIVSNSFAAYRRSTLLELGGFPSKTLFGEDTLLGAKAILNGCSVAYVGSATVYHSHNYNLLEEFRRYFDNGAFYSRERWILESFGKAEGSGKAFVLSELKYLIKLAPYQIPKAILSTIIKYLGYKVGSNERHLPSTLKRYLSMNKNFWKRFP